MPSTKRASIKHNNPLDNLFGPVAATVDAPAPANASGNSGEPEAADAESLRQTTIMVYDAQLNWLDQKCTEARNKGGKPIRKAAVIRALIDLAKSSEVDLTGLKSEMDLLGRLERAIKAKNGVN